MLREALILLNKTFFNKTILFGIHVFSEIGNWISDKSGFLCTYQEAHSHSQTVDLCSGIK